MFRSGPETNDQLQELCHKLFVFLAFTGHWNIWFELWKDAERIAVKSKDYASAGWRAYQIGLIHYLRGQSGDVFICADRAAQHWASADAGPQEHAGFHHLRGLGNRLTKKYSAAIVDHKVALKLRWTVAKKGNHDDLEVVASMLNSLARAQRLAGKLDIAKRNFCKAMGIAKKIGRDENVAYAKGNLAGLALVRGRWRAAEKLARDALATSEKVGRKEFIAMDCRRLAKALYEQGDAEAVYYAERAVDINESLGSRHLKAARETLRECRPPRV